MNGDEESELLIDLVEVLDAYYVRNEGLAVEYEARQIESRVCVSDARMALAGLLDQASAMRVSIHELQQQSGSDWGEAAFVAQIEAELTRLCSQLRTRIAQLEFSAAQTTDETAEPPPKPGKPPRKA